MFKQGDKVIYKNKVYDFGYTTQTAKALLYEEGECNMQDSIVVEFDDLQPVSFSGTVTVESIVIERAQKEINTLRSLLSKCMTRLAEVHDVGKYHRNSPEHSPERTYHECSEYFSTHSVCNQCGCYNGKICTECTCHAPATQFPIDDWSKPIRDALHTLMNDKRFTVVDILDTLESEYGFSFAEDDVLRTANVEWLKIIAHRHVPDFVRDEFLNKLNSLV